MAGDAERNDLANVQGIAESDEPRLEKRYFIVR